MTAEIKEAVADDVEAIQKIAHETWPHAYGNILSQEQLDYMLEALYEKQVLHQLIVTQQQFFLLLMERGSPVAFAAYGPWKEQVYKLHKLYILPAHQRKGYGRRLIEEVIQRVRKDRATKLALNVNRHNNAVDFYKNIGFQIVRNEDIPIGPYCMNDYIMELEVQPHHPNK